MSYVYIVLMSTTIHPWICINCKATFAAEFHLMRFDDVANEIVLRFPRIFLGFSAMFLKLSRNFLEQLLELNWNFLVNFYLFPSTRFKIFISLKSSSQHQTNLRVASKHWIRVETRHLNSESVDLTINLPLHNLLNSFHINPFTAMSDVCRK
jgi:hypothetical protein